MHLGILYNIPIKQGSEIQDWLVRSRWGIHTSQSVFMFASGGLTGVVALLS
jgi:hypothetical protein